LGSEGTSILGGVKAKKEPESAMGVADVIAHKHFSLEVVRGRLLIIDMTGVLNRDRVPRLSLVPAVPWLDAFYRYAHYDGSVKPSVPVFGSEISEAQM
jgi:hypothetical protein